MPVSLSPAWEMRGIASLVRRSEDEATSDRADAALLVRGPTEHEGGLKGPRPGDLKLPVDSD